VDEGKVMVTPSGAKGLMAALDARSGETVWVTEPLLMGESPSPSQQRLEKPAGQVDRAAYSSPILFSLGGRRLLVNCSMHHVFGVDAETGRLLWTQPMPTRYEVIVATPVLCGDSVFVTAPDAGGGKLWRMLSDDKGVRVEKVWTTPIDTCSGCLVRVDGSLYGSRYRGRRGYAAIDVKTGQVRYETHEITMGSVLYADERLYCLSEKGGVAAASDERETSINSM